MERPGGIHPAILMNCAAQAALKFALVSKFYPFHPTWFLLRICKRTLCFQKAAQKAPPRSRQSHSPDRLVQPVGRSLTSVGQLTVRRITDGRCRIQMGGVDYEWVLQATDGRRGLRMGDVGN